MSLTAAKTVRELALESASATRIFERLGIDYCCGGNKSLEQACQVAKLSIDEVINSLEMADQAARAQQPVRDWQKEPLVELISYIQNTHHKYTREELARVTPLLNRVCSVHGKNHPELLQIRSSFQTLSAELTMHLMKEENVLFPYVVRMEESIIQREPVVPSPFGSVRNPVSMMEHEHDSAGNALRAMREASSGYTVPPDGCVSYHTLYQALSELESDLHQHIHLENNILFPRAIAMEYSR
jgi:regulator of cell morphogenesis and NO signaling